VEQAKRDTPNCRGVPSAPFFGGAVWFCLPSSPARHQEETFNGDFGASIGRVGSSVEANRQFIKLMDTEAGGILKLSVSFAGGLDLIAALPSDWLG
jgi:hypothetical protein